MFGWSSILCKSVAVGNGDVSDGDSSRPSSSSAGPRSISEQTEGNPEAASTSSDAANDSSPVHYYVMGPNPRWESAPGWPPPNLAPEPLKLLLGAGDRYAPSQSIHHSWDPCLT